jgi:hypothetical protein
LDRGEAFDGVRAASGLPVEVLPDVGADTARSDQDHGMDEPDPGVQQAGGIVGDAQDGDQFPRTCRVLR